MAIQIVPHIIDGDDVVIDDGGSITTFLSPNDNASDENGPCYVQGSDTALSAQAVESCARAFDTWRSTRLTERRDLFLRLANVRYHYFITFNVDPCLSCLLSCPKIQSDSCL